MKRGLLLGIICFSVLAGCTNQNIEENIIGLVEPEENTNQTIDTEDTYEEKPQNTVDDEKIEEIELDEEKIEEGSPYGEVVEFSQDNNEYFDLVDTDKELVSIVLDLDNDGRSEAVLAEVSFSGKISELFGTENNDEYFCLEKLFFVNEDKAITTIDNYTEGIYLLKTQYILVGDEVSFLTLNGYEGVNSVGEIITTSEDELFVVTNEISFSGSKFFADIDKIVWKKYNYNYWITPVQGKLLLDGIRHGQCEFSYFFSLDGKSICALKSEEKTYEEVNSIAPFDNKKYENGDGYQFIYRENGELDVNYAELDNQDIFFSCDIFFLEDGIWQFYETEKGYKDIDPLQGDDWGYLYSMQ